MYVAQDMGTGKEYAVKVCVVYGLCAQTGTVPGLKQCVLLFIDSYMMYMYMYDYMYIIINLSFSASDCLVRGCQDC